MNTAPIPRPPMTHVTSTRAIRVPTRAERKARWAALYYGGEHERAATVKPKQEESKND